MIEQVEKSPEYAQGCPQTNRKDDVANLAEGGVREKPLEVLLSNGQERSGPHGQSPQEQQDRRQRRIHAQNAEQNAKKRVDAEAFNDEPRKHRRNGCRRRGVCVRQPGMEGSDGRLEPKTHDEEDACQGDNLVPDTLLGQDSGHVGHIERGRVPVQEGDAEKDEESPQRVHDTILERRLQLLALCPESHKCAGGERRNLQVHEEIEQIPRHENPAHPGQDQQKQGVKHPQGGVLLDVRS